MKGFDSSAVCALLVLVILGILLVQGHDGTLTRTFCGIAGVVFCRGAGMELWQFIKRARLKGRVDFEAEGGSPRASRKKTPR